MKRLILSLLILMPLQATDPLYMNSILNCMIKQKAFNELRTKHRIVVIKFFTKTCPPCKAIAPQFRSTGKRVKLVSLFSSNRCTCVWSVSKLFNIEPFQAL